MGDDGDDWNIWPDDVGGDEECGTHCVELTLHTQGQPDRIIERHCGCPECHGEVEV